MVENLLGNYSMKSLNLLSGYLFLILGVFTGVASNGYLKSTEGFTKISPTIFCILSIIICIFCLSKAMTVIPVGFTYATYGALTTTAVTSVLDAGENVSKIDTIRLTNTHASTTATVDLFIDSNSLGTFYIIKNVSILAGTSLVLNEGLSFDNSINGYTMYVKLGAGQIDVLINTKS